MVTLAGAMVGYLRTLLPRHKLALEVVTLRKQLAVLKGKQPRPKLNHGSDVLDCASPAFGLAGPKP